MAGLRRVLPSYRALALTGVLGGFLLSASAISLPTRDWDREGARKALEEAEKLQQELQHRSGDATREEYLRCIRRYQRVYLLDPHFHGTDDAYYQAANLYREMGDKWGDALFYRNAARIYRKLIEDYPLSPHRPNALLSLGQVSEGPLSQPEQAQEAYAEIRARHGKSEAAQRLAEMAAPVVSSPATSLSEQATDSDTRRATVQNIRHWSSSDYTRIVIDLDNEIRYQRTRLANPDRIYFDLLGTRINPDLTERTLEVEDDFLRQIRFAQNRIGVVRVVLDFASISEYTVFELHDPYRIVIDIHGAKSASAKKPELKPVPDKGKAAAGGLPAAKEEAVKSEEGAKTSAPATATPDDPKPAPPPGRAASPGSEPETKPNPASPKPSKKLEVSAEVAARPTPVSRPAAAEKRPESKDVPAPAIKSEELAVLPKTAAPTSRGDRTITRVLGLKIGRIVIDPGHGGHDTGTIGKGGLNEKEVVLEIALQLKKMLEERLNAEVMLTRSEDRFVPLEERTAIANQADADLFLSIHANSSRYKAVSGVETYYLDFAKTSEAKEVAARENATTVKNIRNLEDLVRQITRAEKSDESREFAAMVQKKLHSSASRVFSGNRNRGVRTAPFVVLIGANMPSVLAEVGFLSNPKDEKALMNESAKQRLTEALFSGIESYMKTLGSDVAQNQSNQ